MTSVTRVSWPWGQPAHEDVGPGSWWSAFGRWVAEVSAPKLGGGHSMSVDGVGSQPGWA